MLCDLRKMHCIVVCLNVHAIWSTRRVSTHKINSVPVIEFFLCPHNTSGSTTDKLIRYLI